MYIYFFPFPFLFEFFFSYCFIAYVFLLHATLHAKRCMPSILAVVCPLLTCNRNCTHHNSIAIARGTTHLQLAGSESVCFVVVCRVGEHQGRFQFFPFFFFLFCLFSPLRKKNILKTKIPGMFLIAFFFVKRTRMAITCPPYQSATAHVLTRLQLHMSCNCMRYNTHATRGRERVCFIVVCRYGRGA